VLLRMNANQGSGLFNAATTRLLHFLLRLMLWIGNRRYVRFRHRSIVHLTSGFMQHVGVLQDRSKVGRKS
jgi:hypothetical protein